MSYEFKVGDRVCWVRKGKSARCDGMTGETAVGTVTELTVMLGIGAVASVKGEFESVIPDCKVPLKNLKLLPADAVVVNGIVTTPKEAAKDEARKILIKNAVDSIYYVATGKVMAGKVMARDLAEKYKITVEEASGLLSVVACEVVAKIRSL